MGHLLGAQIDVEATAALLLDEIQKGTAFQTAEGNTGLALWTVDTADIGAPSMVVTIASAVDYTACPWHAAETGESRVINSDGSLCCCR